VPDTIPVMIVLEPLPVTGPGYIVQVPAGSPLNSTLPVATSQVGWVVDVIIGVEGVAG
jgi:hypothetical protein